MARIPQSASRAVPRLTRPPTPPRPVADLCNPLLPPAVSHRIARDLSREFEEQARRERAAGLPVTVMLAASPAALAKAELGFIGAHRGWAGDL